MTFPLHPYPHYPRLVHPILDRTRNQTKQKKQRSFLLLFFFVVFCCFDPKVSANISIVPPTPHLLNQPFLFSIHNLQCTSSALHNTINHHHTSSIQLCMMRTHVITSLIDHSIPSNHCVALEYILNSLFLFTSRVVFFFDNNNNAPRRKSREFIKLVHTSTVISGISATGRSSERIRRTPRGSPRTKRFFLHSSRGTQMRLKTSPLEQHNVQNKIVSINFPSNASYSPTLLIFSLFITITVFFPSLTKTPIDAKQSALWTSAIGFALEFGQPTRCISRCIN